MQGEVKKAEFKIFNASKWHVGIVVAQFNRDITDVLLENALAMAKKYSLANIEIYKVAGCVEIPVVLQAMAKTKKYDCLVALGAIIRGETPHFDYVAKIVSEGVQWPMQQGIPVGFGVLTCNDVKQATARLEVGADAIQAALQATLLIKTIT